MFKYQKKKDDNINKFSKRPQNSKKKLGICFFKVNLLLNKFNA